MTATPGLPLGSTELWFSDATGPDTPVVTVYDTDGTARLIPSHDGPCSRSVDPDGKPLGYCSVCFQDIAC